MRCYPQQMVLELMVVCGKLTRLSLSFSQMEQGRGACIWSSHKCTSRQGIPQSPHKIILGKGPTRKLLMVLDKKIMT